MRSVDSLSGNTHHLFMKSFVGCFIFLPGIFEGIVSFHWTVHFWKLINLFWGASETSFMSYQIFLCHDWRLLWVNTGQAAQILRKHTATYDGIFTLLYIIHQTKGQYGQECHGWERLLATTIALEDSITGGSGHPAVIGLHGNFDEPVHAPIAGPWVFDQPVLFAVPFGAVTHKQDWVVQSVGSAVTVMPQTSTGNKVVLIWFIV